MPNRTFSALSKESERPLTVDYFEPDLNEFETIPWSWLQDNELTLLAGVRKFMPDAKVARRRDGLVCVISRASSFAFEIPALELPERFASTLEQEALRSA